MNIETIRSDWSGRVIDGRFTLLQWLGGSEGSGVFLTELPEDRSQKAAIKLIPADGRDAEAQIAEWIARMPLAHSHLMRLFYTGKSESDSAHLLYAVTEYAEENLAEILPDRPLTPAETGEMLGPLLDALTYLHGKGFAHGRVKPSNILVVNDRVKLSWDNLHVERKAGNDSAEPAINDAPEAASGTLSPSADIWSLGVTLVEALTQHPPLWDRLAESDPVVPDSVPEPFAEIARECLHSDPTRRCTLSDIKARLEKDRSLPEPPAKISEAIPAKFRVWAVVAAVVVLLAVIGVALLRSHQSEPLPPPTEAMQPAPAMTARPSPSKPTATHGARAVTAKDRAVSTKDGVVEQVMPDIPQKAMATIRGRVRASIRVTVDSNGNVSNAAIDSTGSSYFADRALAAAKRWRFKPAQVNGHAVTSEWILRFEFTSSSAEVAPARVSP